MARAKQQNPYSVHPGVAMIRDWVVSLPEKTGKSLEEWVRLVQKSGMPTEKERREWLKGQFKLGTNTVWWIVERAAGRGEEDADPDAYLRAAPAYVDAMFAGSKAAMRPVYDELLKLALGLGDDVRACPCKTIVPLYRTHVFAELKPSTRTRIDLGLALKDAEASGRLLDTGGRARGDRLTHRIPVTRPAEIDDEVRHWLKAAYDLNP